MHPSRHLSHLFVDHDPKSPPPAPSLNYTRFVCISDTHSRTFHVPPGDVLLHAGDLSSWGSASQLKMTIAWLKTLPHPVKIIIAGNHDLCLDHEGWSEVFDSKTLEAVKDLVRGSSAREAGIYYLEHESVQFTTARGHQWKVYGSPAAPRYAEGAFQYEPGHEGKEIYARIPADTDILLTHTPPYQSHDLTKRAKHAGCKDLAARLQELDEGFAMDSSDPSIGASDRRANVGIDVPGDRQRAQRKYPYKWKCRLHVWGHIHEAYGGSIKSGPNGERVQVNAALASGGKPIIVDLRNGPNGGKGSLDDCPDRNDCHI